MQKFFILVLSGIFVCSSAHLHEQQNFSVLNSNTTHINLNYSDTLDYKTKIDKYKKLLSSDFIYDKSSYFLIISNMTENETRSIIDNTIQPAVKCFYNDFFETRPTEVITIFLFKDDESYRHWAKELFSDTDLSRFGYYKPDERTMLMNISTGSGTLVHEMTHALVHYDSPDIPAWFNEGLGSLYERSSLRNGDIRGYVNWRLPTLKEALYNHTYTGLSVLIATDDNEFYGSNSDFYYSQARYLCMYMQEKSLLKKFYKMFRDNYSEDKTGKKFLEAVFNKKLGDIDKDYTEWVNTLTYQ
jgi:hypothetical protein